MADDVSVKFTDNSAEIVGKVGDAVIAALEEIGGEIESQAKRNSRVDTGQLKNSWTHKVDNSANEVTIGSPLQNAIWEEFGTGQYAVNGDGRKTPWKYQDVKGDWHTTIGKKPNHTLQKAVDTTKPRIEKMIANKLKGIGD